MRVPLGLLRSFVPVELPLDALVALVNARITEVEAVHEGPGGAEADAILELDLEPHRPDLFSLLGVARDVAAACRLPLSEPPRVDGSALPPVEGLSLELRTPRCRRYEALRVSGVRVGPSPRWLADAVEALGMRPINNVVDAANLVMMELGQPLHTFDLARLRHGIVLRMAADGEEMRTLDGVQRTLTSECLLVCDGDAPIALAGVMGDAESEVGAGTTDVLIESAAFDMAAVRRASRRLGLRTEASTRFEKGLPLALARPAAERLAKVLEEVAGGRAVGLSVAGEAVPQLAEVALDRDEIRRRLGMRVDDAEIDRILRALGFEVDVARVRVPHHRPDVRIPADLVEEVGRVHGYDSVRGEPPVVSLDAPRPNPLIVTAARARRELSARGWDEVYLPAWIGDGAVAAFGLDAAELITLANPVADDLRHFRTTALPALVDAAVENRKLGGPFALYEIGRVYRRLPGGAIEERAHLAGIAAGTDVLGLRDVLVGLAQALGADARVSRAGDHPHLHPGRAFAVGAWARGGELHPRIQRLVGGKDAVVHFAVDLQAIANADRRAVAFSPPPRFPSVRLDLNVTVPARTECAEVVAAVPRSEHLASVEVADLYALPEGARLTLAMEFNAVARTLEQAEAMAALGGIRAALSARGWAVG